MFMFQVKKYPAMPAKWNNKRLFDLNIPARWNSIRLFDLIMPAKWNSIRLFDLIMPAKWNNIRLFDLIMSAKWNSIRLFDLIISARWSSMIILWSHHTSQVEQARLTFIHCHLILFHSDHSEAYVIKHDCLIPLIFFCIF